MGKFSNLHFCTFKVKVTSKYYMYYEWYIISFNEEYTCNNQRELTFKTDCANWNGHLKECAGKSYIVESSKSRGLHGNVGYMGAWVAWVKLLRGRRGLRGSKCFLRGSQLLRGLRGSNVFLRGSKFLCVGQFFLHVSKFSPWVKTFCVGLSFCVSQLFCGGSIKCRLALSQ